MNPWDLIGNLIGWLILGLLVFTVVVFVIALIITVFKPRRKNKSTTIFHGKADDEIS